MKQQSKKDNQFDFSDLHVKERLQGVQLASFPRRAAAYGLDWLFILVASKYFAMIILLFSLFLFFKGKLQRTVAQSSSLINDGMEVLDSRLAALDTEEKLRQGFTKYLKTYIKVLIIIVYVASVMVAGAMIAGIFMPEQIENLQGVAESNAFLQPFEGILKEVNILNSLFGALLYFSLFTWRWNGQTPGKRLMEVKVIRLNGRNLSFWSSLERVSGYTASASLLLLGFFQYFWDRNRQTTHDKITETIVVSMKDVQTKLIVNEVFSKNEVRPSYSSQPHPPEKDYESPRQEHEKMEE